MKKYIKSGVTPSRKRRITASTDRGCAYLIPDVGGYNTLILTDGNKYIAFSDYFNDIELNGDAKEVEAVLRTEFMYNTYYFFAQYNFYANPKRRGYKNVDTGNFKSTYINTNGMEFVGYLD
jgi:hypothetical protein